MAGLARFEVATRLRNPVGSERIDAALAVLAYSDRAVSPEVVRELLQRHWIVSAGPGRGYILSDVGRSRLAKYVAAFAKRNARRGVSK